MTGHAVSSPFTTFILNVTERCNLACDYCDVFFMADQSWRQQPARMSLLVARRTAQRIVEHVRIHKHKINIALHGGEPLLVGVAYMEEILKILRSEIPLRFIDCPITVQTNAALLSASMLDLFERYGVSVGVSVDGGAEENDRHRLLPNGRSSFGASEKGLLLLSSGYRHIFNGILAVIDLRNDPRKVYDGLLRFRPPTIDVLLPHGHQPTQATPYGDWLVELYSYWMTKRGNDIVSIRLFRYIQESLMSCGSPTDLLHSGGLTSVLIGSDGSMQLQDTLKSVKVAAMGYNVFDHPFDAARSHPDVIAQSIGKLGLCQTCRDCYVVDICGGGQYVHRYREEDGTHLHPSVYCADLQRIIMHIFEYMQSALGGTDQHGKT